MLYKCFPPNLTHVITLPCETQMFSIVTSRWNVSFATNKVSDAWISTQKTEYGLFSTVISCHDRWAQSCQNSCIHGHKCLYDNAFLASLSCSRKATVHASLACWCAEVPSCWNIKKSSPDNLCMSASGLWARKLSQQWFRKACVLRPINNDTKHAVSTMMTEQVKATEHNLRYNAKQVLFIFNYIINKADCRIDQWRTCSTRTLRILQDSQKQPR